ncbi:MAG: VOC family protein [Actinomycetota bacterium]
MAEVALKQKITTFLTFASGGAEEAMNLYTSLFKDSEVLGIRRYGPDEGGGAEGSVMHATFSIQGQQFMCIDSNVGHEWTFTPAVSLYALCDSEEEIDRLFERLSDGGQVFMELDGYPFAEKFAWIADRFGVSWQLAFGRK